MDIGTMPGRDSEGYSGFTDQVNNHYARLYGSAFLLSTVTAGFTLSQNQNQTNQGAGYGYQQNASTTFGVGAASVAAVATAGAVVAAGASNMAGGAQALMAAFSQANASVNGSEGGGLSIPDSNGDSGGAVGSGSALASAMDGDTLTGSQTNSGSSQKGSSNSSLNSSGSFVTNVGKVAAGTVTNLIKGAVDVAKDTAIGRINDTVGGKVAAAIEARGSTSSKGTDETNSLSAGSDKSADLQAEVAAFRDRGV